MAERMETCAECERTECLGDNICYHCKEPMGPNCNGANCDYNDYVCDDCKG